MAYVNVKDWSVDQVTDWIKGLDNVILKYASSFLNNGVTGHQLLNLRAEDLEHLGVKTLGHQEIILEAVEHLRNFHYELDKENLQMLALKLSCAANSLFKELLLLEDSAKLTNQIMTDVHTIIMTVKPLVCWLDRSPFAGDTDYIQKKEALLSMSIKMATIALRDIFSEEPVRAIRKICEHLAKDADYIIQDMSDPMILQPASLDLATLKKKTELGFLISPSNHAIHQISDIKYGYPAHGCNKIENGDEIVQVNYQTVVGWQRKNVMMLIQESPPEIVLTLKKRPRHTKVYGQIYMKPYRLPSRKRGGQNWSRWNDNLPSPRLMPIHDLPPLNIPTIPAEADEPVDEETASSSDNEAPDSSLDGEGRIYPSKPRPILQRRNTITGATPTSKRPYLPIEYWELYKPNNSGTHASSYHIDSVQIEENFLRDKSVSCQVGLDKRPTTVHGIGNRNTSFKKSFKEPTKKKVNFDDNSHAIESSDIKREETKTSSLTVPETNLDEEKSVSVNSLSSLKNEKISFIDEGRELTDRTSMTSEWKRDIFEEIVETIMNKPPVEAINENVGNNTSIKNIIKMFDVAENGQNHKPKVLPRSQVKKPPEIPQKPKPAVPPRAATTKLRGKLDKSHSTPAYDLTEDESTDKLVLDKPLSKLPDVIPNIQETIREVSKETEPFSETTYELGIPVVEPPPELKRSELSNSREILSVKEKPVDDITEDLPPKPPPRNLDVPKPAYPADSPKPRTLNISKVDQPKPAFDFPEPRTPDLKIEHIRQPSNHSIDLTIQQTGTIMGKVTYEEKPPPKFFEPKSVSTPVTKNKMDFNDVDTATYKNNYEIQKPLVYETHKTTNHYDSQKNYELQKVSPTNSIVKAMISSKGKAGKKKNTLTAKRRKVAVADLLPCDIQGYLYQRLRGKHNQSNVHWEKRWFVLLGNCLYGFKCKDDPRAACLIFLSGYTVAVANEVKSRSNAFKVYHTGTVFYFSSEDSESLQLWTDLIRQATLHSEANKAQDSALYSETDESDSEKPKTPGSEKSDSLKKFGSLKKFTSKKNSDNTQSGSTSLDRKWFFHKSSGSSSSKNAIPVPTAQFRSYRKIRNETEKSVTTGNFTSHVSFFSSPNLPNAQNVSMPTLNVDPAPVKQTEPKKLSKNLPINYIHASNPSLCNISDYNRPTFLKTSYSKPSHDNFQGLMTLEELMVKENEQRKLNPHVIAEEMAKNLTLIKPDVVYGEVPIRIVEKEEEPKPSHSRQSSTSSSQNTDKHDTSCFGKRLGSLKKSHHKENLDFESKTATYPKSSNKNYETNKHYDQKPNSSLPRQHKLQEDTQLKFKDRSYEMIYCPETTNDVQFAQNRTLDDIMYQDTPKKGHKLKKQHSFTSSDKKSKSDSLKHGTKPPDSGKSKLKSAIQYTPMSLPLSQDQRAKPKFAFELNLDEKSSKGGKFNKILGSKSEGKKEKTFFGSPKLHRAIFKKNDSRTDLNWPSTSPTSMSMSQSTYSLENSPPSFPEPSTINISPQADYPGLKYPPVFEPETYSLADPQSLSLLRKPPQN